MTLDGTTVLVTGVSGFIGGAVARALVAAGASVRGASRSAPSVGGVLRSPSQSER